MRPGPYTAWCASCKDHTIRTRRHPLSRQVCPVCKTPRSAGSHSNALQDGQEKSG